MPHSFPLSVSSLSSMASPQTVQNTCAEHKLDVDKNDSKIKLLQRAQWLRAAILGANDGLLSTTSIMLGVGAAKEDQWYMIVSGLAGALAGASSMAVGEFVSVSTQRDIEMATISDRSSKTELCGQHESGDVKLQIANVGEIDAASALRRTLSEKLTLDIEQPSENVSPARMPGQRLPLIFSPARSPMMKVLAGDANKASLQGLPEEDVEEERVLPNPYKAGAASALAFLCGSLVPLLSSIFVHQHSIRIIVIVVATSLALALFGGVGAYLGGSRVKMSAGRVLFGGWLSMAITYGLLKPLDRDDKGHKT